MNIIEEYRQIQKLLFGQTPSELLEIRFSAYAFGSGYAAFRVKETSVIISYDGRDKELTIQVTDKPYPTKVWKQIWSGPSEKMNQAVKIVQEYLV